MNTQERVEEAGRRCGLSVCYHNPGDGTKVRIFDSLGRDWFDWHYVFATDGKGGDWNKALIFVQGYECALNRPRIKTIEERLSTIDQKRDTAKYASDPGPVTAFDMPL